MTTQFGRNGEHDVACRSLIDALLGQRRRNTGNLYGLLRRSPGERSDHLRLKMFHANSPFLLPRLQTALLSVFDDEAFCARMVANCDCKM